MAKFEKSRPAFSAWDAGHLLSAHGGLGKGARRSILAALRRSTSCVMFGRPRHIGATSALGNVSLLGLAFGLTAAMLPASATAQSQVVVKGEGAGLAVCPDGTTATDALGVDTASPCLLPDQQASVRIGNLETGRSVVPDQRGIFIGDYAGEYMTGSDNVVIGTRAGGGTAATQNAASDVVAIGTRAATTAVNSIAIGRDAVSSQDANVALGVNADASGLGALVSRNGVVLGGVSTAVGSNSSAQGMSSTALGSASLAQDFGATAVGVGTWANGLASTAVGSTAVATGIGATSLGSAARATGNGTTSAGTSAAAVSDHSTAVGQWTAATAAGASAFGAAAVALGKGSLALGTGQLSQDDFTSAVNLRGLIVAGGFTLPMTAGGFTAEEIGGDFKITAPDGKIYLTDSTNPESAESRQGVALLFALLQDGAIATGKSAIAQGSAATALGDNAIAIGTLAYASAADGVALGSNSIASVAGGATGYNPAGASAASISAIQATNSSNLGAVSVGTGQAGGNRQIVNVAAGTANSDAVNVAQLKAAQEAATAHDYSVKSATPLTDTNYNNTGALGNDSMAAGVNAATSAAAVNATAVGSSSLATAARATALGYKSMAGGAGAVAIGPNASAAGRGSLAIGENATVAAINADSIAMGTGASVNVAGAGQISIAIGANTTVTNGFVTAVGLSNTVSAGRATVIGNLNEVSGLVLADAGRVGANTAIGTKNVIAPAASGATSGTAITVLGSSNTASGNFALAGGYGNTVTGNGSIGTGVQRSSIALGSLNSVTGPGGIALGSYNAVEATGAAIGNHNDLTTNANVFVLGNRVTVAPGLNGAVVLGNSSSVVAATPTSSATVKGIVFAGFAGPNAANVAGDVVSVGAAGRERQLQNVAAGRITSASTDAINGSQLFSVVSKLADGLTHYYSVNDGGTPTGNYNNDGATGGGSMAAGVNAIAAATNSLSVGNGNRISGSSSANSAAVGSANIVTDSDDSIALGVRNQVSGASSAVGVLGGRNIIADASQTAVIGVDNAVTGSDDSGVFGGANSLVGSQDALQIGNDNRMQGSRAVAQIGGTNTATGSAASSMIGIGNTMALSGASSITGIGNSLTGTVEGNAVGVGNTISGGTQNSIVGSNNSLTNGNRNIVSGFGNTLGANLAGNQVIASGGTVAAGTQGGVLIGTGGVVGASNAVALGTGANASQVGAVALGQGSVTATAVATPTAVINGTTYNYAGISPTSTVSIGAAGAERTITNVAAGRVSATSTDAINGSQLFATNLAIGTATELANAGWNVTDAAGNTANIGPNGKVTFVGDGNLAVAQTGADDEGTVEIALRPDVDLTAAGSLTIGNTLINNSGLTLLGGPSVLVTGINAGNMVITNVAPGVALTDAVNVSQLNQVADVANAGWNVTAQGANGSQVAIASATGNAVDFRNGDGNIGVIKTTGSNDVTFDLADNINVDSVTAGNTVMTTGGLSVSGGPNGVVELTGAGLNNGGNTIINVAAGVNQTDAVNVSQLATAIGSVNIGFSGNAGGVVARTSGQVLAIQGDATTSGSYSGGNVRTITDPATGAVNIQIADSPKFGNVTVNADGSGKITGVTAATLSAMSTEAVNGSQIVALGDSMANVISPGTTYNAATNSFNTQIVVGGNVYNNVEAAIQASATTAALGWNVTTAASGTGVSAGASIANVAPGSAVEYVAGNNMMVTQTGTRVEYAVNPNLTAMQSISVTGGPTINGNGIDMGGDRITNMGAGIAPTDAVNVGQLNTGLGNVLGSANAYTDNAINNLSFNLRDYRRDADGGTASAMAMATVPQAFEPGMGIMGFGVSHWQGEQAIALGFSKASDNGRVIVRASGTYNTRRQAGAAVGVGIQF